MNKSSLKKIKTLSFIKKLKETPEVEKIIIYGSRARGDETIYSDLDYVLWVKI